MLIPKLSQLTGMKPVFSLHSFDENVIYVPSLHINCENRQNVMHFITKRGLYSGLDSLQENTFM